MNNNKKNNIPTTIMNERDMLDQLLQVEPNNRFYRSLHEQYQTKQGLTPRQTDCLKNDYNEKLGNIVTPNMSKVTVKTPENHTTTPPPVTPNKNVASATNNNNNDDVLVDHRKRTPAQLEAEFGELNRFKLMCLYNYNKISMNEYETAVKQTGG